MSNWMPITRGPEDLSVNMINSQENSNGVMNESAQMENIVPSPYPTNNEISDGARALVPNGIDANAVVSNAITEDKTELEAEEAERIASTPRVNSQGKLKVFRCKQCPFMSDTKLAFWQHSRGHIRAEKLLTCPKCQFVTEYKHHLEYHIRNHFGSKPFKCDKCPYSCVNKSMLNSHLKSHSNVYQYRCANCVYATKYCHSLKLHLRKYEHQPAMVLNADGSPNPLPIIDVYGTRRGPRQRAVRAQENGQHNVQGQLNNNTMNTPQLTVHPPQAQVVPPPPVPVPPMSPLAYLMTWAHGMNLMNPLLNGPNGVNGTNGANGANGINVINGFVPNPANIMVAMSYNPLLMGLPVPNFFQAEDEAEKMRLLSAFLDYVKSVNNGRIPDEILRMISPMINFGQDEVMDTIKSDATVPTFGQLSPTPEDNYEDEGAAPLDLSKPDTETQRETVVVNDTKATGTRRRKGKAVKLERRVKDQKSDEEEEFVEMDCSSTPCTSLEELTERKMTISDDDSSANNEFTCEYCQLSFGNNAMYTIHMGYHSKQNPYTCNMCRMTCEGGMQFFVHLTKFKH